MNKQIAFIISLGILIPLVIGILKFNRIPRSYHVLVYMLLLGTITELVSYFFFYKTSNAIPYNIYGLFEFILFALLFRGWGNILQNKLMFYSIISVISLVWIIENIVFGGIYIYTPVYWVCYSLCLVLMAVNQMNWLIINDRSTIYKNPIFLICIAVIIFYSYKVLMEIFYYFAPEKGMQNNIFSVEAYVNIFFNILLAVAFLCIPRKRDFIQQS